MASKNFLKNDIIVGASQSNEELFLISDGQVVASAPGIKINLGKGDIVGALEIGFEDHYISYVAAEDTVVIPIPSDGFFSMLEKKNDFSAYIYRSAIRQIIECINKLRAVRSETAEIYALADNAYIEYKKICDKVGARYAPFESLYNKGKFVDDSGISPRLPGYYLEISKIITDGRRVSPEFLDVFISKLSKDARGIVLGLKKAYAYLAGIAALILDEQNSDLYGLLTDSFLNPMFSSSSDSILAIIRKIEEYLKNKPYADPNKYFERTSAFDMKVERTKLKEDHSEDEKEIFEQLEDSVDKILDYAEVDEETRNDFKSLIISYRALPDARAQEDAARHIRRDITNFFYRFYEAVVLKALRDEHPPKVIQMFLEFGYMDEELCTKNDLFYLYEKAGSGYTDPEKGVFTFFQWLKAIYNGERLPSKNEFDVDYEAYVHEQKVKKQITPEQEKKAMNDHVAMVKYELKNMFVAANKVTFGLITIFCPIFNSVNVMKTLPDDLVTTGLACGAVDYVRNIDFQLFYRDYMYTNDDAGVKGEFIGVEVLPDIILMPNVGTRGLMWQEIQGRVRSTPSRLMLPVFDIEDLKMQILHMCGEYRWEMCKRIQGARYNDISDPSLTSEYFDYAQFYRKNHDLSTEAKEKVKLSLQRAKNSFKEMFVMDYMIWVIYESEGAPRLNKVVRAIMAKYCPCNYERRKKLLANPTFKEPIEYYERKQSAKIHRLEMLVQKISNSGIDVPAELNDELAYLKG